MSCLIVLEGEQLQHYAGISNQLENVKSTIVRWFFILEERELMVGSRKHALSEFIIIIISRMESLSRLILFFLK
jgi:hypothetical protein